MGRRQRQALIPKASLYKGHAVGGVGTLNLAFLGIEQQKMLQQALAGSSVGQWQGPECLARVQIPEWGSQDEGRAQGLETLRFWPIIRTEAQENKTGTSYQNWGTKWNMT